MADAVLYARYSPRPNAEQCESNALQLERLRAYCLGHGYTVIAEEQDEECSGARADNRPGFQRAISLACERKAILCVYALSRFARCTRDALETAEKLRLAGAGLASIQEYVDTGSPMGRFVFTLFSALAQLEREVTAERTSAAMQRHQATGRRMTRQDMCPFGKRVHPDDPSRLADHPEELAALARMVQLRRQGYGLHRIATTLTKEGYRPRAKAWHHSSISVLLRKYGGGA